MDCVDKSAGSISQPYRYLHKISHMFLDLKQGGKSVHDLPESERSRIRDVTRKFFEGISPVCSKARLRKACRNFYSEIYSGSEANTLKSVGMISRYRTAPDPDIKIRINAKIQALHGSMPGIPKFEKKKRSEVGKYNPEYLNQIASMEVTGTNNIEKLEEIIKLASKLPAAKQKIFWSHQHFSEPSILTRAFRLSNEGSSDFMLSYFVHSDLKPLEKAEIFRSSTGFGSIDTEWTRGVKKELFNQFKELESKGSNRVDNNVFNILDQASNFDVEEQVLEAEDRVLVEALRNSVKAQDCEAFERAFNALQTLSPPISDEIDMFCNAMRDDTGSLRVITSVEFYSTCMVMFERMANRVTPAACEGNLNLQRMLWEKMGENTPRMDPTAVRQSSATPEASGTVRAPISSNNESASEALKVLGLHDDAFFSMTLDKQIREIHSARNGLALALHPDKNLDVGNFDFRDEGSMGRFHGKTADEATKEVNTAFGILKAFF